MENVVFSENPFPSLHPSQPTRHTLGTHTCDLNSAGTAGPDTAPSMRPPARQCPLDPGFCLRPASQVCHTARDTTAYATAYDIILSVKTICLGSLILGIGTPLSRPSFMGMACGPRSVQRQITSKSQCEWVAW